MKQSLALFMALPLFAVAAPAQASPCDRACLQSIGSRLVDSFALRKPYSLPLAANYAATENSVGSALHMMTIWRTATAVKSRYFAIDTLTQQVFFEASVKEGSSSMFVFGRFKVSDGQMSEIEIYENRARGVGGFMFGGDGPANLPSEWSAMVPEARIPSRDVLLRLGQAAFSSSEVTLRGTNDCVLYENGAEVAELPEVAAKVAPAPPPGTPLPKGRAFTPHKDGTLRIPCGLPPERPQDATARTDIVDIEQGVVVTFGVTNGNSFPYYASNPVASAFVPSEIEAPYLSLIASQKAEGKLRAPAPVPMPVSGATAYVFRVYDSAIQGMQLLVNLGAPGGRSPWVNHR